MFEVSMFFPCLRGCPNADVVFQSKNMRVGGAVCDSDLNRANACAEAPGAGQLHGKGSDEWKKDIQSCLTIIWCCSRQPPNK